MRLGSVIGGAAVFLVASPQVALAQDAMDHMSESEHMAGGGFLFTQIDRLEGRWPDDGDTSLLWDAQGWYGGDINKLWWKSEGDAEDGDVGEAELQMLYSRAITPFFDLQAGVRQDFEPDSLTYGVLGVQGLAPYWFELDAAAFVSEEGDVTSRLEAEYDLLLTQRLVLQPRAEAEIAFQDVEERGLGSGVTGVDLGLRLRYEIRRELAPYVGVEWSRLLGDTADLARAAAESDEETVFILGVRAWF
ncbi:MAG: copper resistance protein B [Maricaulaceae bacterium]|jgi:copper resistance protein B